MTLGAALADKCAEHLLLKRNRPIPDVCVPKTILGSVYPRDRFMQPHTSEKLSVSCVEFNSHSDTAMPCRYWYRGGCLFINIHPSLEALPPGLALQGLPFSQTEARQLSEDTLPPRSSSLKIPRVLR